MQCLKPPLLPRPGGNGKQLPGCIRSACQQLVTYSQSQWWPQPARQLRSAGIWLRELFPAGSQRLLQARGEQVGRGDSYVSSSPCRCRGRAWGLLKLCLGLHSNSPLCPLGLSVLQSQLSTCSFSERDDICCCVMHIVTSLVSVHTKGYCEKISI